jgi:hypothetical protein
MIGEWIVRLADCGPGDMLEADSFREDWRAPGQSSTAYQINAGADGATFVRETFAMLIGR